MVSIAARACAGVIVWKGWAPAAAAWSRIAFIWGSSCIVASSGKIKDDLHRTMRLSAELDVLASAAQTPRLTSGLSLQAGEVIEKTGVRLRHTAGIFDSYAGEFEAGYGERHRDAMVVVGFDGGGLGHRRFDAKAIVELIHRHAEAAQFRGERAQAVTLVMADEGDVADSRRRRGERRDRGERRHHVGHCIHIDIDAGEAPRAGDFDRVAIPLYMRTHPLEHAQDTYIPLDRIGGQAHKRDGAANQRGGGGEIARAGRIRLDHEVHRAITLPAGDDDHGSVYVTRGAPSIHQPQCHVDEGPCRVADNVELESSWPQRRRHEQCRDELRGKGRIESGFAAFAGCAGRVDHDGRVSIVALARCVHAEPPQCIEERADWPFAHPIIPVEPETSASEREKSCEETHRRASATDVEVCVHGRDVTATAFYRDPAVRFVYFEREPERF